MKMPGAERACNLRPARRFVPDLGGLESRNLLSTSPGDPLLPPIDVAPPEPVLEEYPRLIVYPTTTVAIEIKVPDEMFD
jgi:hypothetical protein